MKNEIESGFSTFRILKASPGTIVYTSGSQFGPRIQQDWQLFILDSGSLRIWIDEVLHIVQPGHIVLLKPGHREKFEFAREKETWHRWITIEMEQGSTEFENAFKQLPFSIPVSEEMNRLVDQMIPLKHKSTRENEMLLRSLGLTAFYLYAAEVCKYEEGQDEHPAIFLAKNFVQRQYSDAINLSDLSKAANVTVEHLIRLFNRHMKMTPMHYLWQYRVKQGVDLLVHTGLTITEVAYQCGFKTSYHFARMIKKGTNHTPTDIRNRHWKMNQRQ